MTDPNITNFFWMAAERERMRILRDSGARPPWTTCWTLETTRLCNVFREDDRTTRWLTWNVMRPTSWSGQREATRLLLAIVGFRWFNRIETGQRILGILRDCGWNRSAVERELRPMQLSGEQIISGAYMLKTPAGHDKLTGILDCMDHLVARADAIAEACLTSPMTMQQMFEELVRLPYLGNFMAYQAVRDLRHTHLVRATDVDTWAVAGPGCAQGLGLVFWNNPDAWSYTSVRDQTRLLSVMRDLLGESRALWPWPNRQWSLQEVQTWACEYAKIRKVQSGATPKRRFDPEAAVQSRVLSCT